MAERKRNLAANLPRLAAWNALQMALFPVAIITLYQEEKIGLDMGDILLLQGIFGLAMVLLEFPSGYIADRIGYRRALLFASAFAILGWTLYLFAESFAGLLAAEIVLGVSMALISGCDSALLYESLVETNREHEFTRWTGRIRFAGQSAEGTAALFAGILYAISPKLPFLLQLPVWLANAVVAWGLQEPARHIETEKNHLRHMAAITRSALVERRDLRAVIALTVTLGLTSFIPVWIVPLYAVDAGLPVAWVGPMWAAANYVVAITALASDRLDRRLGTPNLALLGIFLVVLGYTGLSSITAWWGFVFYFALTAIRGLVGPALLHREQRLVPSADRAAFLSLRSLIFRLSFLVLGPVIGAAIDEIGFHSTLAATGLLLVGACGLSWWKARPVLG
jgi:MFS family permease